MRELDENEKFVEEFATSGYSCSLGRDNAYFYEWLIPHEQWTDVHYLETVAALYLETVWLGVSRLHAALTKRCKVARHVQAACILYICTRAQ